MSESIYNLVPREYVAPVKEPRHISKHNPQGALTGSTFGCQGTTRLPGAGSLTYKQGALFGPPKALNSIPTINKNIEAAEDDYRVRYESKRKSALPTKAEVPVFGIRSSKNFITANAVEAILQVPKVIDKGKMSYLDKEDYGKIPQYLSKVKDEIRQENEMIDRYVKEQMGGDDDEPERFERLSEIERASLLTQLKQKWDTINASYQCITHLVVLDTRGQARRKENLERELETVEADIEKLNRVGPMFIKY